MITGGLSAPPPSTGGCDRIHSQDHYCGFTDCYTPCFGRHYLGETACKHPNCTGKNLRGYDQYVNYVRDCKTPRQMWTYLWTIIQFGPPGDSDDSISSQRRKFNREVTAMKKELADLMRPVVLAFIERWRTSHAAGEL